MASELEYSYPVIEHTADNDSASKSLPPEKVFVIAVVVIFITGSIIYGISKMVTAPSDYQKLDLNSKKSSNQNDVAGSSVVGPYGKPQELPSPTPIPATPTSVSSDPTTTPTPTKKPDDPTNTPVPPTVVPSISDMPEPSASPSAEPDSSETP